jgi:uncharacterized hydrophobic protein (TIGR00271 family)
MLQMRVFIEQERAQEVGGLLQSAQGARHVVIVGPTFDGSKTLITAELTPAMTDEVMHQLIDAGVLSEEIDVEQSETVPTIEAGERSWLAPQNEALVWSAVVNQARTNARFSAKYAVFMAIAGIIAAFGVMTENAVLIVGAMALAPDLTPVTATSVGLVGRRWRLAGRGLLTLVIGYAFTTFAAQATSSFLRVTGQLPSGYELPMATVQAVASYSMMIIIIAFAAGVAGIFAFETKAGAAVGVAISVTTIPAAAYVGTSIGLHQTANTAEALVMLGVNVLMLLLGAIAGLMVQLAVGRRRGIVASTAGRKRPDTIEEASR